MNEKMDIRLAGFGPVSLEELEARFAAYVSAGAPEPVLEGTPDQRKKILEQVAVRGDKQMKAVMKLFLSNL